ncbi:hypothetical protein MRX96_033001 [Rhipicephalus microplus]
MLQYSSPQLRVLHTTTQKIKKLPPLLPDEYKVVFRFQGGDLTTQRPRYLLAALMQAAELTDLSTLTLQIQPVNNTCTVSAVNQKEALKLVQLHQITYEQHEYAMTAYITPPDGSVRGVITDAFWKKLPQELLDRPQPSRKYTRRSTNETHKFNSDCLWSSHSPRENRLW